MRPDTRSRRPSDPATRRQLLSAFGAAATASLAGCGSLSGDDGGSNETTDEPADPSEYTEADVVAAIEEHAVPLETTDRTAPLDDVAPIAERLAEYPIVGLGEATHGTREFDTLRARLIEQLVTEHGLRGIGIEDRFAGWIDVNRYVVHGEGDLRGAVDAIPFGIWTSQGIRELLGWLREFNDGRPIDDRVAFHGLDPRGGPKAAEHLLSYLDRVDPGFRPYVDDDLRRLAGLDGDSLFETEGDDELVELSTTAHGTASLIRRRMTDYRLQYVGGSSEREYRVRRHLTRALEQAALFAESELPVQQRDGSTTRDELMAENTSWLYEHAPGDGVVYLGHNGHVKNGRHASGSPRQGKFLTDQYGEDYYRLAFTFGRGSFLARPEPGAPMGTQTLAEPEPGVAENVLVEVEHPLFFLDFETAMEDPILADWLRREQTIHGVGAVVPPRGMTPTYYLAEAFSGLVFVRETTAERRL